MGTRAKTDHNVNPLDTLKYALFKFLDPVPYGPLEPALFSTVPSTRSEVVVAKVPIYHLYGFRPVLK